MGFSANQASISNSTIVLDEPEPSLGFVCERIDWDDSTNAAWFAQRTLLFLKIGMYVSRLCCMSHDKVGKTWDVHIHTMTNCQLECVSVLSYFQSMALTLKSCLVAFFQEMTLQSFCFPNHTLLPLKWSFFKVGSARCLDRTVSTSQLCISNLTKTHWYFLRFTLPAFHFATFHF